MRACGPGNTQHRKRPIYLGIGGCRSPSPDVRFSSARTVLTALEILCDLVGLGRYISVARPPELLGSQSQVHPKQRDVLDSCPRGNFWPHQPF